MKLFGLIGNPLGHSFSKNYFTSKFEKEGLGDCYFELFPLPKIEEFPLLLQEQPALKGLAVTIPYKQAIISYLTRLSPEAEKIGAVNCIRFTNKSLTGFNTDVVGFEKSFVPLLQPQHQKALVLGTGGASKAVQYILQKLSIPFTLVSRKASAAEGTLQYDLIDQQVLEEHLIVINCSPVGMPPNEPSKPAIPYEFITKRHYLYDLVYAPNETAFINEGKRRGAIVKDGFEMLICQAEENWRLWNEEA